MFLVSNFYNVFYLTGFKGLSSQEREAWVVVTKKIKYLITDGRHDIDKFKITTQNLKVLEITPKHNLVKYLTEIIKKEKIKLLGFEAEDLRYAEYKELKKKLTGTKLIPVKNYFLKKRKIKTGDEIGKIKKACQIGDQCLQELTKTFKVGQTEREIAFKLEYLIKQKGYDTSFSPIVAIDQNAAIPHYDTHTNGKTQVGKNSLILIDFGVKYKDYCSDMTRVLFIGKPKEEVANIYGKLLEVQGKTIDSILRAKSRSLKSVDTFCREELRKLQLPNFPHSTGHGIGLEVHELPRVSQKSKDKAQTNQVFTIEPGVYIPGKFGLRIEDTLYIDKNKGPVVLTNFTKKPFFLQV